MNDRQRYVVIGAAVAVVLTLLAWFFRYDFQVVNTGGAPGGYMLNRWTGTVYLVYASGVRELKPFVPLDFSSQGTPAQQ